MDGGPRTTTIHAPSEHSKLPVEVTDFPETAITGVADHVRREAGESTTLDSGQPVVSSRCVDL